MSRSTLLRARVVGQVFSRAMLGLPMSRTWLCAATLAVLLALGSVTAVSAEARTCPGKKVVTRLEGGSERLYISATNISCKRALAVIREWFGGPMSRKKYLPKNDEWYLKRGGWTCSSGAGAGNCRRGRQSAGYGYMR